MIDSKYQINPEDSPRAQSYKDFIVAPMPMVTIFQTLDTTRLVKKMKKGYKYNMLMCYCIGQAAQNIPEMLYQIDGQNMYKFDKYAIDVIICNKKGTLSYCDVPVVDNLEEFNRLYLERTQKVYESCENMYITDASIICTSAVVKYELDGLVNLYHTVYDHHYMAWGKFTKSFFRYKQKISFQWHHVLFDAADACRFTQEFQNQINKF